MFLILLSPAPQSAPQPLFFGSCEKAATFCTSNTRAALPDQAHKLIETQEPPGNMEKSNKIRTAQMSDVAQPQMTDVRQAKELILEIAGHCWDGRGGMLERVFAAVVKAYPKSGWTQRKIRALYHLEAAGVRFHQMIELATVAERQRKKQEGLARAKASHAEYIAATAALVASIGDRREATGEHDGPGAAGARGGNSPVGGKRGGVDCAGAPRW